jgi:hypothetical protein
VAICGRNGGRFRATLRITEHSFQLCPYWCDCHFWRSGIPDASRRSPAQQAIARSIAAVHIFKGQAHSRRASTRWPAFRRSRNESKSALHCDGP